MTLLGKIGIILLGLLALAIVIAGVVFLAILFGFLAAGNGDHDDDCDYYEEND